MHASGVLFDIGPPRGLVLSTQRLAGDLRDIAEGLERLAEALLAGGPHERLADLAADLAMRVELRRRGLVLLVKRQQHRPGGESGRLTPSRATGQTERKVQSCSS